MARGARLLAARARASGEIRPVDAARARARTRCWCARCAPGSAGAPRRWSSAAACRPSQYAAMRAPFQEGDFPGPVKYGYLNVGVVEQGPPALLGRTVFCLYPHQTALRRPGRRRDRRAGRRAARAGGARRHRGDRGQRAVGRRARWSATGSPWSAPAWSAAASRACWPASRRPRSTAGRRRPARAAVAAALGVDFAAAGRRRRRPGPGRARQRHRRRPAAVARPARRRRARCSS